MNGSFSEALELMLTGMSTVFVILILVVLLGNLIIIFTNRIYVAPPADTTIRQVAPTDEPELSPQKLAAIIAAVEAVTGGKGKIEFVDKSNQ